MRGSGSSPDEKQDKREQNVSDEGGEEVMKERTRTAANDAVN